MGYALQAYSAVASQQDRNLHLQGCDLAVGRSLHAAQKRTLIP